MNDREWFREGERRINAMERRAEKAEARANYLSIAGGQLRDQIARVKLELEQARKRHGLEVERHNETMRALGAFQQEALCAKGAPEPSMVEVFERVNADITRLDRIERALRRLSDGTARGVVGGDVDRILKGEG